MPSTIAILFNQTFSRWNISLPPEALETRQRGTLNAAGWTIHYLFGADERGDFLDYYAAHRMTNDRHVRLYESGAVEILEAPLPFMVFPPGATDEEKQQVESQYFAENRRIYAALKAKGFA